MSLPSAWASIPDWIRMAALKLNPIINGYPFQSLDTAPTGVDEGYTYYDTTLHKARVFDGTSFQNLW